MTTFTPSPIETSEENFPRTGGSVAQGALTGVGTVWRGAGWELGWDESSHALLSHQETDGKGDFLDGQGGAARWPDPVLPGCLCRAPSTPEDASWAELQTGLARDGQSAAENSKLSLVYAKQAVQQAIGNFEQPRSGHAHPGRSLLYVSEEPLMTQEEMAYWHEHFQSQAQSYSKWGFEDFAPAFAYGTEAFRSRRMGTFEENEENIRHGWKLFRGASRLSWDEAKESVQLAWWKLETGVLRSRSDA